MILGVIAIALVVRFTGEGSRSGTFVGSSIQSRNNAWIISLDIADGWIRRNISLCDYGMANFRISSINHYGGIIFTIRQGEVFRFIDISSEFDDYIDFSEFESGAFRIGLQFNGAREIETRISWGTMVN